MFAWLNNLCMEYSYFIEGLIAVGTIGACWTSLWIVRPKKAMVKGRMYFAKALYEGFDTQIVEVSNEEVLSSKIPTFLMIELLNISDVPIQLERCNFDHRLNFKVVTSLLYISEAIIIDCLKFDTNRHKDRYLIPAKSKISYNTENGDDDQSALNELKLSIVKKSSYIKWCLLIKLYRFNITFEDQLNHKFILPVSKGVSDILTIEVKKLL
jgi:hypothetical protein